MCEAVPGIVVAGDLQLDNRGELANRLNVDDTRSDAELVAHAYRRWGRDFLAHLLGVFAFCLWDERSAHLFCARDHLTPVDPRNAAVTVSPGAPTIEVDGATVKRLVRPRSTGRLSELVSVVRADISTS